MAKQAAMNSSSGLRAVMDATVDERAGEKKSMVRNEEDQ